MTFDVADRAQSVDDADLICYSPTIRQVANQNAQPIPAVYQAASASVVSVAFEADIKLLLVAIRS